MPKSATERPRKACQTCGGHGFHGEHSRPSEQTTCPKCDGRGAIGYFRCRITKPKARPERPWQDVENYSTPMDAAMELHHQNSEVGYRHVVQTKGGGFKVYLFAEVEVEGFGPFITWLSVSQIWRESELGKGPGLEYIERQLKMEGKLEKLIEDFEDDDD